jgi:hypothetical protein
MHWTTLNIPTRDAQVVSELQQFASSLARIDRLSLDFQKSRSRISRHPDNCIRACGLLLTDFAEHGRKLRVRAGKIQFSTDTQIPGEGDTTTNQIRRRLHLARSHQLGTKAVKEFISSMEKRRLYQNAWVSIFSLMRDGRDLEQRLRRMREGKCDLKDVVDPYIQVVQQDEVCPFTGLELMNIWRYFRHTWANPYNSVPGRSLMILIRDAAAENHPVVGIAALASSAVQLGIRDEWIGWSPETVVQQLRAGATENDVIWLDRMITRNLSEIYLDDLLSPSVGPLNSRILRLPNAEAVEWLQHYSSAQREIHHQNSNAKEHKSLHAAANGTEEFWRTRAESALFRSKRAENLALLLRAKLALCTKQGKVVNPEEFRRRLQSSEGRQAIQSLIRKIKSEHVGIALADISVCGAVPPYSPLTGGKLVAMLLASPEVVLAYEKRYADAESVIASSIAGRAIVRHPHLVMLGTTSIYGSEPNQYTRVQIPCDAIGGVKGSSVRFELLGKTEGYGTFQFSDQTVDALGEAVAQFKGGKRVNSIFGEGVNPRLRKIRDGLDLFGLDSDELLMHGNPRLVYAVPLALNFRDYILGKATKPEYPFSLEAPKSTSKAIVKWWAERWLSKRIQRDDVLADVAKERLTYPIRHGARVQVPEDVDIRRLNFQYEE